MPKTVNEQLRDADINHQVDLQHYANSVVRRIIAILNRVDADLFTQLTAALEKMPPESFTVDRLQQLLSGVRNLNAQAYAQVADDLMTEMKDLASYESGYQHKLFTAAIPAQVVPTADIVAISAEQAYAAAMARPFQGRLLSEWSKSIEADRMTRIRDAIRMGYVQNEPIAKIVQRLRGTRAKGYGDGIIEIDRRNAEAVVRTAVSHTAGFTRDRFLKANRNLIKELQWTSTLDSRTSPMCRIRDGLRYTPDNHLPIGHKVPWGAGPGALHWCCRSTSVPILKSWSELGGKDVGELNPVDRASMDGVVPAETTYAEWLGKQSAARQDEILGPTRGKLMRAGNLELERFYNDKGKMLTLSELRHRDTAAFAKAGL